MERQRSMYTTAIRLATALSALAVVLAVALDRTTDVPRAAIVTFTVVVGFVSSWVATARHAAAAERQVRFQRRVTVLPVHSSAA